MIQYINQNLRRELSLQELCDQFYISRAQLCRRFRRATGTTVGNYITVKRLMGARQEIRSGAKPTQIYTQWGYRDYATFYRAYVQHFGTAPRADKP